MKRYFYYNSHGTIQMVSNKPLLVYEKKKLTEKELVVTKNQIRDLSKHYIIKIKRGKLVFEESLQEKEKKLTIEKVLSVKTIEELKEVVMGLIK